MIDTAKHDAWSAGDSYEHYMGRWSNKIALEFFRWLEAPEHIEWLEIGCGTGALSRAILENCAPRSLIGIEPSEGFAEHARTTIADQRARFEIAKAEELPLEDNSVVIATSALVLNFIPDKSLALAEMKRVTRSGGIVSFYVWNYPGGGVDFIDEFWKAAGELDEDSVELDESKRFPFCTPDGLLELCAGAGLSDAEVAAIEIPTYFDTFADFLHPFTLGAGPAPSYFVSLTQTQKEQLQEILKKNIGADGPIQLAARAWAVKVINP